MNPCDHIECRDYQTCAFDRGREGGLKAGDECHELRERIAGLRKELADEKVAHVATRKSLKELEDRFFQTLLHGGPQDPRPTRPSIQAEIDATRIAAAKEIIGKLSKETDFRLVAENWCATSMQELANATYFRDGRDELLRALRRVLNSDSDNKFEMKEARAAARVVVLKYNNIPTEPPEEHWVAVHETTAWGHGKTGLEAYTDAVRCLTEAGMEIPTLTTQLTVDAEWSEIK